MASIRLLPVSSTVLVFLTAALALADDPGPKVENVEDGLVAVVGTVRTADGSPAAGAVVEGVDVPQEPPIAARADADGRFRLRGGFHGGARLVARSRDGAKQTSRWVAQVALGAESSGPLELTLAPAIAREVEVVDEGRPVDGAEVAAIGMMSTTRDRTGPDGKARLLVPANDPLREMIAWHPRRGFGSIRNPSPDVPRAPTRLTLLPPRPLTLRVVDPAGKPVAGLEVNANFQNERREWLSPSRFDAAFARTDADGVATFAWAPRDGVDSVSAVIRGPDWKTDRYSERAGRPVVTIAVRRRVAVEGSLAMPAGANPDGLLIAAVGVGPGDAGDRTHARARPDGTFTLRVLEGCTYAMVVADLRWTSDVWKGLILDGEAVNPAGIVIPVHRATPLTVVVTRGEARLPIENALLHVYTITNVEFTDQNGKKQSGTLSIPSTSTTDRLGQFRTGLPQGPHRVQVVSDLVGPRFGAPDAWSQERAIDVASDKPMILGFHRD